MRHTILGLLIVAAAWFATAAEAGRPPQGIVVMHTTYYPGGILWSPMPTGYAIQYHRKYVRQPMNTALSGRYNISRWLGAPGSAQLLSGGMDNRALLSGGFDVGAIVSGGIDFKRALSGRYDVGRAQRDPRWSFVP